jgi:[protein-PII] uridylyltransferase
MADDALDAAVDDIRRRFFANPAHVHPEADLSDLLDRAVIARLDPLFGALTGCAVLAAGGYGRRTLHPFSDLDLLVLFSQETDPGIVARVPGALGGVGFSLGHQVRRMSDFSRFDPDETDSCTAFFDARHLSGDRTLSAELGESVLPRFILENRARLLAALDQVRARRRSRYGQDREAREPDVKHGVGGLRDYHWIRWVSRVLGEECSEGAGSAAALLHRTRNFLHYLSGRDENVLSVGHQSEIGRRLGYAGAAEFMEDYRESTDTVVRCLEDLRKRIGS